MMIRFSSRVCVLLTALLLASCGVSGPSSNRQLDFVGDLDPTATPANTADKHDFTVTKNGEFQIRLTALSAGPNVPLGLSLGTPAPDGGCLLIRPDAVAVLNQLAMSGPMVSGNYCVVLFDIGQLTGPTTYTLRASVP